MDVIEDNFRKQVMNFRGNKDMDIFTYKKWLIRLFDIGKNGNFKGFPNPVTSGKRYDHRGGVKIVTDGVTASVFYVKRNQELETLNIIDDEDEDVKMESKDCDGAKNGSSSSKKLILPLPPRSELIILPFFLYQLSTLHTCSLTPNLVILHNVITTALILSNHPGCSNIMFIVAFDTNGRLIYVRR